MTERPDLVGQLIDAYCAWDQASGNPTLTVRKEEAMAALGLGSQAHDLIAQHRRSTVLTHGTEHRGHSIPDAITSTILELAPHLLEHDHPEAA